VVLPVFPVVLRAQSAPFSLAITLVGLVVRIVRKLLFLPFALAGALAVFLATIPLILHPGIGVEKTPAMGGRTLYLYVHGLLLSEKDHKLMRLTAKEENREEHKPESGKQNHFACAKWKKKQPIFHDRRKTLAGQARDMVSKLV